MAYDPQARTITVTLTASGLTPGAHAAHIHVGSCASQGPVQYMLMDFMANSRGQIRAEVRTVTGVTMPVPATGWYLNLHQGTSSNILANGQPTPTSGPCCAPASDLASRGTPGKSPRSPSESPRAASNPD